jgi:hypothetical protein
VPEPTGRWTISELKGAKPVALQLGGVLMFGVSLMLGLILRGLYQGTMEGSVAITGFSDLLFLLVGVVGGLVLHEAVHGILFRVFGGRARFGAKLLGGSTLLSVIEAGKLKAPAFLCSFGLATTQREGGEAGARRLYHRAVGAARVAGEW